MMRGLRFPLPCPQGSEFTNAIDLPLARDVKQAELLLCPNGPGRDPIGALRISARERKPKAGRGPGYRRD
jgi:hypothetical protein